MIDVKEKIKEEMKEIADIYFAIEKDFGIPKESRSLIPKIKKEDLKNKSHYYKILQNSDISDINKIEPNMKHIIEYFESSFKKHGPDFRTGTDLGLLVFEDLKKIGYDFPETEATTVGLFKDRYKASVTRYSEICGLPTGITDDTNFLKNAMLLGFLHPVLYEKENPHIMKLFENFEKDFGFATEGSVLVYQLKTLEYLKQKTKR